jgi:hypothetical protein
VDSPVARLRRLAAVQSCQPPITRIVGADDRASSASACVHAPVDSSVSQLRSPAHRGNGDEAGQKREPNKINVHAYTVSFQAHGLLLVPYYVALRRSSCGSSALSSHVVCTPRLFSKINGDVHHSNFNLQRTSSRHRHSRAAAVVAQLELPATQSLSHHRNCLPTAVAAWLLCHRRRSRSWLLPLLNARVDVADTCDPDCD